MGDGVRGPGGGTGGRRGRGGGGGSAPWRLSRPWSPVCGRTIRAANSKSRSLDDEAVPSMHTPMRTPTLSPGPTEWRESNIL